MAETVAVLFARRDSIYKSLSDCDVWDEGRDATRYPGVAPIAGIKGRCYTCHTPAQDVVGGKP